ncbi:E3 ubiquitin-protein ligase HUWE1 [Lingula anatina]|uniref:E3 ubiquitin-protein ligase HUWE1 n=1 Tax=Lingula anatina TaxID=7574 RepID=A0A2R2MJV9_LINAN|nr:E3 ubiquitin-protein ligase HUWE1 [Lingula anatina]|eukprot:XP_023930490.1 E3 ubiquitin-protein ligase HUWE1 [Lingula anatina]
MKIDRTKLKKGNSELPAECRNLIDKLKICGRDGLVTELQKVKTWTYGKCELFHWADVLDVFDEVLEKACRKEQDKQWVLPCDMEGNEKEKDLLLSVLQFTALLIEHSFSRHLYNSMEHLTTLLSSSDMTVVLGVLNLLYVFSKRSNFITRLAADKKQALIVRLTHLAESWGGKDNGFGLAECCRDLPMSSYPSTATTLHFEFYAEAAEEKAGSKKNTSTVLNTIHIEGVDQIQKLPSQIMEDLLAKFNVPEDKKVLLFTHIRLAHSFSRHDRRLKCVQARLQAISILVYSNAIQDNVNSLLYTGLIEELVDIVELKTTQLVEIKAAALRTLTSIIHLDRNPKLNAIIDVTGASSYHGFLPALVRNCIQHMIDPQLDPYPQPFATALFSFLYHLASYESGGEALVSCGMMESLLKVINWYGDGQEHITFVTRAVRVVDLITNLDMAAFQSHQGLTAFINRLEHEVEICRREQPFVIRPTRSESISSIEYPHSPMSPGRSATTTPMDTDHVTMTTSASSVEGTEDHSGTTAAAAAGVNQGASTSTGTDNETVSSQKTCELPDYSAAKTGFQCFPQRAALLKSMLNFLKKAIPDPAFSESIRHLMDGSLPRSLKHIISNAEYYGPSLFLLATDVVTVYVFQEPSLLSSLQDNGLTDVVLHALLIKDVPATREVLASLPNVFSALCLNTRGLQSFVECKPFDRLFKVLLSPDYLPAMRRRRSSDPLGDTASNLGNAMDELMRHQPSLRTEATKAIIKLLEEVCSMGQDVKYICQKPAPKAELAAAINLRPPTPNDAGSSEDEDDEDDGASTTSQTKPTEPSGGEGTAQDGSAPSTSQERIAIPLMDYVLNVMKFVESILSNNTTDDHCREFVSQKGLGPLMGILGLPNLPIDFPASPSCQAVASVCKSVLTLSHEPQVLKQGLLQLNEVLQSLEPLHKPLPPPGGSVLLRELVNSNNVLEAIHSASATPLLHAVSSAHAYIMMFVHVCRVGQSDIRSISVSHWGSELGLQVLKGLSQLYTSLVWESTVLLSLCSEDILPPGCEFGKVDMEKLLPKDFKVEKETKGGEEAGKLTRSSGETGSNGVSAAMETLTTSEAADSPMDIDIVPSTAGGETEGKKQKISAKLQTQIKQIKPLLSASSRLGRALAELFGLLVKLCVGSPIRHRRSHQIPPPPTTPSPAARAVASALMKLLGNGLSWEPPPAAPVPKLRLTFLICSVGFTAPLLFDNDKYPYYLMLQKFLSCGGHDALFNAFEWALSCGGSVSLDEGLETPELPDGTGEFLDAWLMLIEKMVNTKHILESPHKLPAKSTQPGFVPFSSVQYLVHTQKAAFQAVMHLWGRKPLKVYGSRMSESILAILCHIIKGEAVIKEKLAKELEESGSEQASASGSSTGVGGTAAAPVVPPVRQEPELNPQHLQQLMDMGFTREHCADALLHTTGLEQATEYLLTHPVPAPALQVSGLQDSLGLDVDMVETEEDQMMRAIAMSLGENVIMSTDGQDQQKKEEEEKKKKEQEEVEQDKQRKEDPLEKEVIDHFTDTMIPGCLKLLDTLPETVYRVCDLLVVVTQRNGDKWRANMLECIAHEISVCASKILEACQPLTTSDTRTVSEWASGLSSMPEASRLATRLHLLTLLAEEMKMPCAEAMERSNILELLVQTLDAAQQCLSAAKLTTTPKWLAALLLLIDLYEKMSMVSKRRMAAEAVLGDSHTWKWFDDRTGRWCNCSVNNNKTIDDSYRAGEASVRFTAGRRRYIVHFNTMIQVNEETGNRRPIMLSLPSKEEKEKDKKEEEVGAALGGVEKTGVGKVEEKKDEKMETEETKKTSKFVKGLTPEQINTIVRASVGMIAIPVEPDTLHAVMRLCLRVTREHQHSLTFTQLGGARLLLNLTQASAFQGFTSLATLLLRHVLEDPANLRHTMEKVVRTAAAGTGSSMNGVAQGSIGAKEMHYVLRALGPAACRQPELFKEVAQNVLRIALPPPSKRDEDDSRITGPNAAQILKTVPVKQSKPVDVALAMKQVTKDLLDALAVKYTWLQEENEKEEGGRSPQTIAEAIQEVVTEVTRELSGRGGMLRQDSSVDLQQQDDDTTQAQTDQNATEAGQSTSGQDKEAEKDREKKAAEEEKKKRPLLLKSAILRLLAELVRSYSGCAQLITSHTYQSGQTELVSEDCNVLAFLLDNLLPNTQTTGDRDCPALARVLLASLAACNHSPEAQNTLVSEVKAALQRALALPESSVKHARVQALTGMISTMIESCPTPGHIPNQVFKGQQSHVNQMVKVLLKKGLVMDLARVPHSLDLSSPHMATTVNTALKPLETLSRIVNSPTVQTQRQAKQKGTGVAALQSAEQVANNIQEGEELSQNTSTVEPSDETLEGAAEEDTQEEPDTQEELEISDMPPMDESEIREAQDEEFQDMFDQLIQRDRGGHGENEVLAEMIIEPDEPSQLLTQTDDGDEVLVDVEVDTDDVDPHDSQMITQEISDDEVDNTHVEDDHPESDDHQSDADDDDDDEDDHDEDEDEDNEEEEEDNDDDEDDDEEDIEDDEGSDMEAYNDDMPELESDMHDDDLFLQLEEMFPPGQHIILGGDTVGSRIRTYQLPVSVHDQDNGNDNVNMFPSVPPAPSNVTAMHPLLVRTADIHGAAGSVAARVHRTGRQRGTYRYNPSTQTLHVHYPGNSLRQQPNPPAILQRLLGPSTAADVLQLTNTLSHNTGGGHARIVVRDDDFRVMSRDDDFFFEEIFQDPYMETGAGSSVLTSIPSALTRWTEESRVLDGDSINDCVTALKPDIVSTLEKYRDEELAERKEKRKKAAEEEAAKKDKDKQEKTGKKDDGNKTIEWGSSPRFRGPLTATGSSSSSSATVTTAASTTSTVSSDTTLTPLSTASSTTVTTAAATTAASVSSSTDSTRSTGETSTAERIATAIVEEVLGSTLPTSSASVPAMTSSTVNPLGVRIDSSASSPLLTTAQEYASIMSAPLPQMMQTPAVGMRLPIVTPGAPGPQQRVAPATDNYTPRVAPLMESPMDTVMPPAESLVTAEQARANRLITELLNEGESGIQRLDRLTGQVTQGGGSSSSNNSSSQPSSQQIQVSQSISSALQALGSLGARVASGGQMTTSTSSNTALTVEGAVSQEGTASTASSSASSATSSASAAPIASALLDDGANSLGNNADQSTNNESGLPDGVDPSFLAALPENIRQEVIAEQLRLQRIQQRAREQSQQAQESGVMDVSPEFLAALPPNIQEEVLAQQRAEQARLSAQAARENPEQPVDPAGFISSLPTSLRQQVLADMDDSMVAVLPAELAAEAQALRRELEDRHRRIMQERLFSQGAGSLSAILRHSGLAGRIGGRYPIQSSRPRNQWAWVGGGRHGQALPTSSGNAIKLRGRHLLDHDALTCLLVLLFVDEPKLNTSRLHRVLRNMCYHQPTRTWTVRALLSILQRTHDCRMDTDERQNAVAGKSSEKLKKKSSQQSGTSLNVSDSPGIVRSDSMSRTTQPSWLSISMDAALGCRANVFQIQRLGKKHSSVGNASVHIHPQAAPLVCRHVLDTLISLAKSFPAHFLPSKAKEASCAKDSSKSKEQQEKDANSKEAHTKTPVQSLSQNKLEKDTKQDLDFWEILVKLDNLSGSKKGKGVTKSHLAGSMEGEREETSFDSSPIGQLMTMLAHPVVKSRQALMDRLLRLLGLVAVGLPDITAPATTASSTTATSTTTTTTTTTVASTAGTTTTVAATTTTTTASVTTSAVPVVAPAVEVPPIVREGATEQLEQSTALVTDLNETMDVSHAPAEHMTSTPLPGPQVHKEKAVTKPEEKKEEPVEQKAEHPVLEAQLHLAVQVLISKSCSEEGLEDATNLLLQLSRANNATREKVLHLLLAGARELGRTVCDHIRTLMDELKELNLKARDTGEDEEGGEAGTSGKGTPNDRYAPHGGVVINAPVKIKGGRELQLTSMAVLTSKASSQQFFLRILKVIIQLREAARNAVKTTQKAGVVRELSNISTLSEAMAALEAEAEMIMELVGRRERLERLRQQGGGQQAPSSAESSQSQSTAPLGGSLSSGTGQSSETLQSAAETQATETTETQSTETESTATSSGQTESSSGVPTEEGSEQVLTQSSQDTTAPSTAAATPMDVDQAGTSDGKEKEEEEKYTLPRLSEQLQLEKLWEVLGECLSELARTPDHHAVLVLQPAVEAFFIVHAGEKDSGKPKESSSVQQRREDQTAHLNIEVQAPMSPYMPSSSQELPGLTRENSVMSVSSIANLPPDTQKFLRFAETHRTVLNQILRQSTTPLADGPFSVLVDHTRVLDFDVKRRYFRQELERADEGMRREDLAIHVRRDQVFEDSFRELHRRTPDEWKHRFYVVFEGEEGQDAGGLLREWYLIISREIFNPNYALFSTSSGDRVTYTVNPSSHFNTNHLSYFKFVGRIIAKAIYDNKLLECYFTRSFYKHILGVLVKYQDMESEDYAFFQGMVFLMEHDIKDLGYDLTFSTEIQEFGVTEVRDLIPNGRNILVTEENKREYVRLVCQMKMTGAIRKQISAFLEGFYDIIPKKLISIFNEQELELLISGLPTIDIDDLKSNSEYHKYQSNSLQIQWFWRALRSFDQADRARFLQFVTGTSKVPLQGFAHLEGMNGTQKFQIHRDDRSTDRLPTAHTCFNQLDLPAYETYDKLRNMLLLAINECSEGFGLA